MGCVYCATNKLNGKKYIGKTIETMQDRMEDHRLTAAAGDGYLFHKAIRKHGWDAFEWEILFRSESDAILMRVERIEIADHNTHLSTFGYNLTLGGDGPVVPQATRDKISKSLKGRRTLPEGYSHSKEVRDKISRTSSGRRVSLEAREKLRARKKGKTWEEIYGSEAAAAMRIAARDRRKGKTYEQLYGDDRAVYIKRKQKLSHSGM